MQANQGVREVDLEKLLLNYYQQIRRKDNEKCNVLRRHRVLYVRTVVCKKEVCSWYSRQ